MQIDKDKIRFKGKLITAALGLNASVSDTEAKDFIETIYAEWQTAGLPLESCSDWLQRRLSGQYCSYRTPPVWVEDEAAWPYFEGKPMIFVSQTSIDQSLMSQTALSPGETIYVFAIRKIVPGGFRMVYRVVSQFE